MVDQELAQSRSGRCSIVVPGGSLTTNTELVKLPKDIVNRGVEMSRRVLDTRCERSGGNGARKGDSKMCLPREAKPSSVHGCQFAESACNQGVSAPRRDPRRSSPAAVSRLNHFFANVVEPDDFGSFAVVKMAGDGVLDHGLKFLFRVRRCENRVP